MDEDWTDWTKAKTIKVPKHPLLTGEGIKQKTPLELYIESINEAKTAGVQEYIKTMSLEITGLETIPEIHSATIRPEADEQTPDVESPILSGWPIKKDEDTPSLPKKHQTEGNLSKFQPQVKVDLVESDSSHSLSEHNKSVRDHDVSSNYSQERSQYNETRTEFGYSLDKSKNKMLKIKGVSFKSMGPFSPLEQQSPRFFHNATASLVIKNIKKEVKQNTIMYPKLKMWHEKDFQKSHSNTTNAKVIFTAKKTDAPKLIISSKTRQNTSSKLSLNESEKKEEEVGVFDFEQVRKELDQVLKEQEQQRKLNKVLQAITDPAYEYARKATLTNRKVEPEPHQTIESLAQLLNKFVTATATATTTVQLPAQTVAPLVPSTNRKKIEDGNERNDWQLVTSGIQAELQIHAGQFKQFLQSQTTTGQKLKTLEEALVELQNSSRKTFNSISTDELKFQRSLEHRFNNQAELNEKLNSSLTKTIDDQAKNFDTLRKLVKANFEANEKHYSTKAELSQAIERLDKSFSQQILLCSKKSQCSADFVVVKDFRDHFNKNETYRNAAIESFRHMLTHLHDTVKDKVTQAQAEQMQKQIDSMPQQADLERFSLQSIQKLREFESQQNEFLLKFTKSQELIAHYDEVITQKANKITVEQQKIDLTKRFDKQIEKLTLKIEKAQKTSEDTQTSILAFPLEQQNMIRKGLEVLQMEQDKDVRSALQLFEEFKGTYNKDLEQLRSRKLDQSLFEEQLGKMQQFSSQLQHAVVMLHESIAVHEFKAEQTKQAKNTRVIQLLEQIQSLRTWVLTGAKDTDNLPSMCQSLVSSRQSSRRTHRNKKPELLELKSFTYDLKSKNGNQKSSVTSQDTTLQLSSGFSKEVHRLNPIVRRIGRIKDFDSESRVCSIDTIPETDFLNSIQQRGNLTER